MLEVAKQIAASILGRCIAMNFAPDGSAERDSPEFVAFLLKQVGQLDDAAIAFHQIGYAQGILIAQGTSDWETEEARCAAFLQDHAAGITVRPITRIAVDRDDPGYRPDAMQWAVTLDGKFLADCTMADAELGIAFTSNAQRSAQHTGAIKLYAPGEWESSEDHAT